MMWVVMYWPVQSWMVSLIGSFDSTATAATEPASPAAASIAAVSFLTDIFIFVASSCPWQEPDIMHELSRYDIRSRAAAKSFHAGWTTAPGVRLEPLV